MESILSVAGLTHLSRYSINRIHYKFGYYGYKKHYAYGEIKVMLSVIMLEEIDRLTGPTYIQAEKISRRKQGCWLAHYE